MKVSLVLPICLSFAIISQAAPMNFDKRRFGQEHTPEADATFQEVKDLAQGSDKEAQAGNLSGAMVRALLAKAPACDQQDRADEVIDLGRQFGGEKEQQFIEVAKRYRQLERNTPNAGQPSELCDKPPKNKELEGLVQNQDPTGNPDDGDNGKNPDDGDDGKNPDDGDNGKNPDDGDNGKNPDDGDNGKNPDDGDNGKNPDDGDNGKNPDDGDNGKNPDDGDDGKNPDDGDDGKNPDDGDDGKNPDDGDDGKNPDDGDDGKNPDDGDNGKNPDDGDDGKNPDDGDDGKMPEDGDNGKNPDDGDDGDNGKNPDSDSENIAETDPVGGVKMPKIKQEDGDFIVNGNGFNGNLDAAHARQCDVQKNLCFNKFNGGDKSFSGADCEQQVQDCKNGPPVFE